MTDIHQATVALIRQFQYIRRLDKCILLLRKRKLDLVEKVASQHYRTAFISSIKVDTLRNQGPALAVQGPNQFNSNGY